MKDQNKTRDQLLAELAALRGRVAELEAAAMEQKRVEEALRESEERFRKSFDTELVAMAISRRRDGMYLEANRGFVKVTGYPRDEIIGHTSQELQFFSPSQRQALINDLDQHGRLHNRELTFPTKEGVLRTILFSIGSISLNNEDCLLATMVDITDRKQAGEALREREAKIRSVFRAAPIGIGLVSHRVLLDVNDRLCEITGYSNDELIGKNARILYPTDEAYETVGQEKYRQIAEQGTGTVETCFQRKDGQIIDVLLSSTPLDPADLSTGVTFTVLDVTERRQMEEDLRASESMLRRVIDLVPYPIFAKDVDGRFLLVNRAGAEFAGLTVGQMQGSLESDWVTDREVLQAIQADDRAVIEEGEPRTNLEDDFTDAQGCQHVMRTTKIPFWGEKQEPMGLLGISVDITELKRADKALRQYAKRLQIQHEIDQAILAAQSAEEIAQAALERLQDLIPCRRASIAEIDLTRKRGRDLVVLIDGELRAKQSVWYPLSGVGRGVIDVIRRGRPYVMRDLAAVEAPRSLERILEADGMRSTISVPLLVQDVPVGTLNMSSEVPDFFTAGHAEILEEIAASLAIALQQARLLEQSQRDAETRALLLREVNHRVLNNLTMILSILNLEQRRSLDTQADFQAALSDVASRIDGMTVVHRMLSGAQWAPLDLAQVVTQVIHAGFSGSPIQHHVDIVVDGPDQPLRVSSRQAIAVALIVNELTTNSIKYAFEDRSQGRIDVEIATVSDHEGGARVQLIFRDDGPGMPDQVLAGKRQNVGLWLVETNATRALGGEMTLHNDGGAVTSITFEQTPLDGGGR